MSSLSRKAFVVAMFLATPACLGWGQELRPLRQRIPKADVRKYRGIQSGKDWKNPYLIVKADGIEILGVTPGGHSIATDSVAIALMSLPDSAWPYGLVVAVQDIGIVSGEEEIAQIKTNRRILIRILSRLGAAVNLWPSA